MAHAEHYDVVVLGRSLAGALCACMLARRKLRVALCHPAGRFPTPDPEPLFGLSTAPAMERVLDEIGLVHKLRTMREGREGRPLRVCLPDADFELPVDPKTRREALAEGLPRDRAAVLELLSRVEGHGKGLDALLDGRVSLPAEGFSARRQLKRTLAAIPAIQLLEGKPVWSTSARVRGFVAALLAAMGRADPVEGPMTLGGLRALWHLMHGVAPLSGGRAALHETVLAKLRTFGGTLVEAPTHSVELRKRRVAVTDNREGVSGATALIWADGVEALSLLGDLPHGLQVEASWRGHLEGALEAPAAWSDGVGAGLALAGSPIEVRWTGEAPTSRPLTGGDEALDGLPADRVLPSREDPLGLFSRAPRGPHKHLAWCGPSLIRGLGLEGDALSALIAAEHAERITGRRR